MRFAITKGFADAETAWREAYSRFDTFAEAGDDGVRTGGTAAADEAGKLEGETLCAFVKRPAVTSMEIKRKIEVIQTERLCELCVEDLKSEYDQIKLDLTHLWRPNAGPEMAEAFAAWAEAHRIYWSIEEQMSDEELQGHQDKCNSAAKAILELPCTTPGDFVVKRYVQLMFDCGTSTDSDRATYFIPDVKSFADDDVDLITYRDIADCDLGRCMIILGKVDFSAAEWMRVANQVGKDVRVTRNSDGRGLSFGMMGPHSEVHDMLQYLMAGGLQEVSAQRCIAIADEIEANYPALVFDLSEAVAA